MLNHAFSLSPPPAQPPLDTIFVIEGSHEIIETVFQIVRETQIKFIPIEYADKAKETRYQIDNGSWIIYTTPFSIPTIGRHTLNFYSINTQGVAEPMKTHQINVMRSTYTDFVEPNTISTVNSVHRNIDTTWFMDKAIINLSGRDINSGNNHTYYALEVPSSWYEYKSSIVLDSEGRHVVFYYSVDKAGNTEYIKKNIVQIDASPPTVESVCLGSYMPGVNISIVFDNTIAHFQAFDALSGINVVDVSLDNQSYQSFNTTDISLNFSNVSLGGHTLTFTVHDGAGHSTIVEYHIYKLLYILIVVPFIVVILLILLIIFLRRRRRYHKKNV